MPSENIGDRDPTCPQEWAPPAMVKAARGLRERHGPDAEHMAELFCSAYYPYAWGFMHWTIVLELLRGERTEADVLAMQPPPGKTWPRNPTDDGRPYLVPEAMHAALAADLAKQSPFAQLRDKVEGGEIRIPVFTPMNPETFASDAAEAVTFHVRTVIEHMAVPAAIVRRCCERDKDGDGNCDRHPPREPEQGSLF
jgi:hypothetical protein